MKVVLWAPQGKRHKLNATLHWCQKWDIIVLVNKLLYRGEYLTVPRKASAHYLE